VESPSRLEQGIRQARVRIAQAATDLEHRAHNVENKWIEVEQNTERTVKEVIAPNERMKPEVLYIAVAGLAGTIAARNRNILIRIASPILFTVAASYYFIPQTTRNIAAKILEHESISNVVKGSKSKVNSVIVDLKGDQSKKKE